MKTFKFSLVLRTRENTDVFISLSENIYGIYSKTVNILFLSYANSDGPEQHVCPCSLIGAFPIGKYILLNSLTIKALSKIISSFNFLHTLFNLITAHTPIAHSQVIS